MKNIIGITLMQNQIYMAAPGDGKSFRMDIRGGDEEIFATAKQTSEQVCGQPATEAVAVIPARLTITQRGTLAQKAARQGLKITRFLSAATALVMADYARRCAAVRQKEPLLMLSMVLKGTYLEAALVEVGDGVAEVLAIVVEEQANVNSIPKAFRRLLADAGKNPEDVRRLLFAEDAIQNETLRNTALDSARSDTDMVIYTASDLAMGAAAYGAKIKGSAEGLLLLEVLPRSIGFKLSDGTFHPVLQHNETIPVTRTVPVFSSGETAPGMEISLYEGESQNPDENKKLGTFHATGAAVSIQDPKPFEVCLDISTDGILSLIVKDPAGNKLQLAAGPEGTHPLPALKSRDDKKQETAPEAKAPAPAAPSADGLRTALKFLPVYDDLLLALAHPTKDPAYEKGIRLTLKKMEEIFREHDVVFFGETGEPFDPHIHEAVMHLESPLYGTNVIALVLKKGVNAGGKIIRYAKVQVAN